MKQYRTRQFNSEIRFSEKNSSVDGYAAVFNTPSDGLPFIERIRPGAFTKTISDGAEVKALFNHDPNFVLASTSGKTLQLAEDQHGLRFSFVLPDTTAGRDLKELLTRGDINKCSFGFVSVKDQTVFENGQEIRELIEVRLFDVSLVCFPAYSSTSCFLQRSILENDFNIDIAAIVPALVRAKAGKTFEDDAALIRSLTEKIDGMLQNKHATPRLNRFLRAAQ